MSVSTIETIEFEDVSEADWRALVEKSLKGASIESLNRVTEDGFTFAPLYERRRNPVSLPSHASGPWAILQRIDDPDPERANAQTLSDLEGGAAGLSLVFQGAPGTHGYGIGAGAEQIRRTLEGVHLGMIPIRIEASAADSPSIVETIESAATEQGAESVPLHLAIDWFGATARSGSYQSCGEFPSFVIERAEVSSMKGGGAVVEADGRVFHDAGATNAQELAAVLAAGLSFLRMFDKAGIGIERAAPLIGFTLSADQRQFETMAKLRAARLCWARILEECRHSSLPPIQLHAETSWRMMTARDPHTNILRATIAAFAAATGGADSLTVLPHTAPLGLPDANARRIARNIQVILQDESGLGRVVDPAAGAGGLEALTDLTAEAAWEEFRRIESEGGLARSLEAGALQNRIEESRAHRQSRIMNGVEPIVGVTLHPLDQEPAHNTLKAAPVKNGPAEGRAEARRLPPQRSAEMAESRT